MIMNTKRYFSLSALLLLALSLTSCNEFLSVVPDNRTELDTEDKIISILVSAYSDFTYMVVGEFSSDNVDKLYVNNVVNDLHVRQLAQWTDVTDSANDSPTFVWQGFYSAIAAANQALEAIDEFEADGKMSDNLLAAKGEALMIRAYHHFILANVFCQAYNPDYADQDLGLPYKTESETTLNPMYERGNLADYYAQINADIEEALPLVSDNIASTPKYHFCVRSSYAFAARFNLYYQQWDKAITYATRVLGSNPASDLRDKAANKAFGSDNNLQNFYSTLDYISSSHSCNLLISTAYSEIGLSYGSYEAYTEYNHGKLLSDYETFLATTAPWEWVNRTSADLNQRMEDQSSSFGKVFAPRVPYLFEYTDPVALVGYARTVIVPLTTDETLLSRAEAYIMNKDYNSALSDMNIWLQSYLAIEYTLTDEFIALWRANTSYYTPTSPTIRKSFDLPTMTIDDEEQESYLSIVSYLRRLETLHTGQRFFDMKRYGYTAYRRELGPTTNSVQEVTVVDILEPRDPRCAIQIPSEAIAAGFEANPR